MPVYPTAIYSNNYTDFNDIFKYMRENYHRPNLVRSNIISVSASTIADFYALERTSPDVIFTEPYYGRFITQDVPDIPNLTISFKKSYINLTSYTIYVRHNRLMKSWDLFGKTESTDWTLIDRRQNQIFYKDPTNTSNFIINCTCLYPAPYTDFLFNLTRPDNLNNNIISISRLFFFGNYFPFDYVCTYNKLYFPNFNILLIFIFILI